MLLPLRVAGAPLAAHSCTTGGRARLVGALSEFFEPPPPSPPEPEPDFHQPPWVGPPHGTLPGVVALELVLAQTEKVAVYVLTLLAYPTGFEFDVLTISADRWNDELDPMMFGPHRHRSRRHGGEEEELPDELLRIGVQFANGAKATNTAGFQHDQEPPPGPVMQAGGGGGGGGQWHQTQWVWPLPPPGPLSFVCEWPAAEIALTRSEIDAQIILDAASHAQVLFPDQSSPGTSWTSSTIQSTASTPKPQPHSE